MKHRVFIWFLIAEGVLLGALALLTALAPSVFSSLLAFPFEQVAAVIFTLSKGGAAGNGLAVAVLAGLSLLPVLFSLGIPRCRKTLPERISLFAMAVILFTALYGMVNPGGTESSARIVRAFFALSVWSVVILFVVLRLIRLFRGGSRDQLLRYLRIVLFTLCMYFTAGFAVSLVSGLRSALEAGTAAGVFHGFLLLASRSVPLLLDLMVCLKLLSLLDATAEENRKNVAEASIHLTRISCLALAVTTGLSALLHIIQVLLLPYLSEASADPEIPVISIFFVVTALLLSRLLTENLQLREDSSLII